MAKISDEPAVVLQTRPYRENSLLVNLLTLHHGRIGAVSRGARSKRRGQPLQPFTRLSVNWYGRSNLVTLTDVEAGANPWLTGQRAAAGFYLLELVSRLLHEGDPQPRVFVELCLAINHLAGTEPVAPCLRRFECRLLQALGYGLDFGHEAESGRPLDASGFYQLVPQTGFVACAASAPEAYSGSVLQALAAEDYERGPCARAAKRIFRRALEELLGPRPLTSRELLVRPQ